MKTNIYNDIWESQNQEVMETNTSEVDGVHILARVKGDSFFCDKTSANDVHYPRAAWENALKRPDFIDKLKRRLIYGTIGHGIVLDDNTLRDGKFSHLLVDVYIDENTGVGMAEYLVLNTPSGRILNTMLRAGSKFRVSTKCKGLFESRKHPADGSTIVDKDNFILERIDFVLDPGFVDAQPDILESLNSIDASNNFRKRTYICSKTKLDTRYINKKLLNITEDLKAMKVNNKVSRELAQYRKLGTPRQLNSILECLLQNNDYNLARIRHNIVPGTQQEKVFNSLIRDKVNAKTLHDVMESLNKKTKTRYRSIAESLEAGENESGEFKLNMDKIVSDWDEETLEEALADGSLETDDISVNFYEEDGSYFISSENKGDLEAVLEHFGFSQEDYGSEITEDAGDDIPHPDEVQDEDMTLEDPDEVSANTELEDENGGDIITDEDEANKLEESRKRKARQVNENRRSPSTKRYSNVNENRAATQTKPRNSRLRKLFNLV